MTNHKKIIKNKITIIKIIKVYIKINMNKRDKDNISNNKNF